MNQPAFPTWKNKSDMIEGMTLKDFFAAAVLQGIYSNPDHRHNAHFTDAIEAYAMADAMMKVRDK